MYLVYKVYITNIIDYSVYAIVAALGNIDLKKLYTRVNIVEYFCAMQWKSFFTIRNSSLYYSSKIQLDLYDSYH